MLYLDNNWAAIDLINLQDKIRHINHHLNITYANNLSSLNVLIKGQQGIALGLFCLYPKLEPYLKYVPIDWKKTVDLVIAIQKNNEKRIVHEFINFIKSEMPNFT